MSVFYIEVSGFKTSPFRWELSWSEIVRFRWRTIIFVDREMHLDWTRPTDLQVSFVVDGSKQLFSQHCKASTDVEECMHRYWGSSFRQSMTCGLLQSKLIRQTWFHGFIWVTWGYRVHLAQKAKGLILPGVELWFQGVWAFQT